MPCAFTLMSWPRRAAIDLRPAVPCRENSRLLKVGPDRRGAPGPADGHISGRPSTWVSIINCSARLLASATRTPTPGKSRSEKSALMARA